MLYTLAVSFFKPTWLTLSCFIHKLAYNGHFDTPFRSLARIKCPRNIQISSLNIVCTEFIMCVSNLHQYLALGEYVTGINQVMCHSMVLWKTAMKYIRETQLIVNLNPNTTRWGCCINFKKQRHVILLIQTRADYP